MRVREFFESKGLSHRQAEVAELVCKGWTNKQIAAALFVTEKTVKFHLTYSYRILGVPSRAKLIVLSAQARMAGEITEPQPEQPVDAAPPADALPFGAP